MRQIYIYYGFIFLFITGLYFSKDFGVSWDENYHRNHGKENIAYILRTLGLDNLFHFPPHVKNPDGGMRGYGPIFEILCLGTEKILLVEDGKKIYELRHKINFSIYFISVFIFYLFLKFFFNDQLFGLIGAMFYFLNPRVLSHGFYNPKDSIAQAFLALAILPLFLTYKNKNITMCLISGLLLGIAITIRLPIIYVPCLFILLVSFRSFDIKLTSKIEIKYLKIIIYFSAAIISSIFFFSPILWEAPIKNIQMIFGNLNHHPWVGNNLYLGKLISASNVPWHYIPVWILVTTPITFLLFFIAGILKSFGELIASRGKNNLFQIFMFSGFIVPVIIITFLNSTLYNGWRHLFFIYPFIAFFMAYGFLSIYKWFSLKFPRNNTKIMFGLVLITFTSPLYFIFSSHPNQQVYFNKFAGTDPLENFEGDYWAVSMRQAVDWIVENDPRENINVLSPINVAAKNNVMLDKKFRKKLNFIPIEPISSKNKMSNNNQTSTKNNDLRTSINYFITNSRMEKEGFALKNKNEVFSVKSGHLKLWSVYRIN